MAHSGLVFPSAELDQKYSPASSRKLCRYSRLGHTKHRDRRSHIAVRRTRHETERNAEIHVAQTAGVGLGFGRAGEQGAHHIGSSGAHWSIESATPEMLLHTLYQDGTWITAIA